ncbi:MAG: beta-N-acetylhexosaminidase [Lachnospiraceae bacterium]|nr:beta-N-acetylhexosaminidase [Lachnospiraceae bacterium]
MEKREARRRRRKQSQRVAYISMAVFLAVLIVGVSLAVGIHIRNGRKQEIAQQEQQQQKVDALFASEEEIVLTQDGEVDSTELVTEMTPEQKLDEIVNAGIEVMPLEDKVAGLFIVTPEAITGVGTAIKAGDGTKEALSQYAVGGVVYFGKNMQSAEQISEMIENTVLYSKYPLFIAVDEEGGSVSRVADAGLADKSLSALEIGETGNPNLAYETGTKIGTYLSELGFNLDFAPDADLNSLENNALGTRTYGKTAEEAIPYVTSMMKGLEEQKVTACLKHFPGIGNTTQDTHDGISMTDRTKEQFYDEEFKVFQAGIDNGANMIMVGHVSAPYLTVDSIPCSMSSVVVTDILRNEMGFKGVIISDAMNMAAVSDYYSSEEAAVQALRAGCDMILMPENFEEAYQGVLWAVQDGVISEERINDSLRRIYRIKYADKIAQ